MRKTILYIAMSPDGYIADDNGGVDWLGGQDPNYRGDYGYGEFITGIDTVVMGYTTYRQIATELFPDKWPYAGLSSYVITHREIPDANGIKFTSRPLHELISTLKQQEGKAVWICGGANIVNQLMDYDLIDEYHFTLIPTLLGKDIRLFEERDNEIPLRLIASSSENGAVNCIYGKR